MVHGTSRALTENKNLYYMEQNHAKLGQVIMRWNTLNFYDETKH
jgi:hypothetical protein